MRAVRVLDGAPSILEPGGLGARIAVSAGTSASYLICALPSSTAPPQRLKSTHCCRSPNDY